MTTPGANQLSDYFNFFDFRNFVSNNSVSISGTSELKKCDFKNYLKCIRIKKLNRQILRHTNINYMRNKTQKQPFRAEKMF